MLTLEKNDCLISWNMKLRQIIIFFIFHQKFVTLTELIAPQMVNIVFHSLFDLLKPWEIEQVQTKKGVNKKWATDNC